MIRMFRPALGLVLILVTTTCAPGADFYVAPGGNDANPGSEAKPFATLARARDAVRAAIAKRPAHDLTVAVRAGTFRIAEPVVFGPADGGTEKLSVTYAAFPGEKPVFSGGRVISGWKAGGDGTWTAEIPDVAAGKWTFRELFVNGRRAVRARHPNKGYLCVEQVGQDRRTNFRFAPGDLHAYGDLENVELVFLHDWSITRTPIKSIDQATRRLTVPVQIGGPSSWAVMDWFEKHPRYYLENSAEFLDAPGEWFLDPRAGVLKYHPRPGEAIGSVEAIAPVAEQLLVVRGDADNNRPVRNLHFVGLGFEHAAWFPPGRTYWGRQACTYSSPGASQTAQGHRETDAAAVQFDLTEACSFRDGRIAHVGRSGIWLRRGCRRNRIIGTAVSDLGGNGIMIGEGQVRRVGDQPWWSAAPRQAARENLVKNNLVERCGRELFGAVGIWVGLAGNTTIARNEIREHPYTGVSLGWMWWNPRSRGEPRKTPCTENVVADNHIHHVMQTLSDGGGIYTLGTQPGSALRGNHIHDVKLNAGRAESNGMFLDQGTGGFVVEQNVIYNIDRSPLRFHKGWTNLVRDNVLEVGQGLPPVRYNDTLTERIRLEGNNIVKIVPAAAVEQARRRAGPEAAYRERFAGAEGD